MKRKYVYIAILVTTVFCLTHNSYAVTNLKTKLRKAEKLLSNGEYDTAYKEYLKYAEKKNPLAEFIIGLFHHNGWGRKVNSEIACQWFEKAALQNIPAAAHYHAGCLFQGTRTLDRNQKKAIKWYEKASNLGHYISLC